MKIKTINFSDIKDNNFIMSPSHYINKAENKETKLIIEGQEFEIIKYEADTNDKWFVGELGLVITRKHSSDKLKEVWSGASSGQEENQLEALINYAKTNINYWKKAIDGLDLKDPNYPTRLISCENKLNRAKHGLSKLEEIKANHAKK
jgi:hypothetical protein